MSQNYIINPGMRCFAFMQNTPWDISACNLKYARSESLGAFVWTNSAEPAPIMQKQLMLQALPIGISELPY